MDSTNPPLPRQQTAQEFQSENTDGYRLGRGYMAATRLNLQHYIWKDTQGFLLHPTIQAHLHDKAVSRGSGGLSPLHIADLATGTGLWLFDLAKSPELSGLDVQFHGTDISKSLFPHSSWLPRNVTMSASDILQEPPQSLQGQFDVIHLRLVLSLIRSGSPRPIIRHIKSLLKPGGYMQWDELDPVNRYEILAPGPEVEATHMNSLFQRVRNLADWSWVTQLSQTLKEEGFEAPVQQHYESSPEMMKIGTCMELCTNEELARNWPGKEDEESQKWLSGIPKAYKEVDESVGVVLRISPTVIIARKPL
ncbi:hypothetical protein F5Y19DRAFT_450779 [Xylariaceae sp. FL1651]|nr:hypothetical protein F5Y19DRAFT_450779 [Xylariaceae sp. FL1651]